MRVNALAVRWGDNPGGWTYESSSDAPVIEGALGLGHVKSRNEAVRIAGAELDHFALGQTEYKVGIDPEGGAAADVPFDDWGIGDLANVDGADRRVIALTVAADPDRPGRLIYVPQIGDVVDSHPLRMARASKKMTNGTLGGASRAATPLSQSGGPNVPNCCPPTFNPGEG